MKISALLFLLLIGLAGCASNEMIFDVQPDLNANRRIYVQSAQNDSNHLDQLIANELVRLGYEASAGVRTMMPDNTQLVISYESQWNWDFRTYLLQLNVTVRDVRTDKQLGHGRIFHASVTNKSPEKMIEELLKPMFGPKPVKSKKKP